MKKRLLMPMHLQFFAEEGDNGGEQDGTSTSQEGLQPIDSTKPEGEEGKGADGKTFTRDDVAKMIAAETNKAKQAWEKEQQEKQAEAEKLAQMDEKQKSDHEKQKLLDKINLLEQEKNLAQMSKTAASMLADKGIQASEGILSFVVKETADDTSENVNSFISLIESERETIKAEFEKRIGAKLPTEGTSAATLSRGAQMAKQANSQTKQPENNPWATN